MKTFDKRFEMLVREEQLKIESFNMNFLAINNFNFSMSLTHHCSINI